MRIVPAISGYSSSRVCQMQYHPTNLVYSSRSSQQYSKASFPLDSLKPFNFHVPIKFEIFTESIALILTVTNYCIWQTRKKQLDSDHQKLNTVKLSSVLARIFNHMKTRKKKENSQTDKTNYEMIKHVRTEVGKKPSNLFK